MKRYNLIQARKQANISTRKLADIIGVSSGMITQLENCRCKCSIDVAFKLERFFGIPASELLAEGDEKK
ncbi:Cro/C1-type helix-turn-helix domain [Syntrophomonas zehnderi OL-4]|uniref:Cro/C1-type helix-turn-helix domain n=1 Tax=Syntrophomonas zehnderi OL-4 TaxID=690567 RepID=A0A0E4C7W3_9FIRM|nr:helix-turn-helix transcriptional regulator [Syntrophomonas zehnderi]CFX15749.1 Cro/C1-type helix-turn-helix domain [Syntrophomonas zehnderi OL-4]